jgi:hypothetical protein
MPRQWQLWYWGVTLTLKFALSLLAWRIVEQDRTLVAQRMSDTRESAADRVVAVLERRLIEVEKRIGGNSCHVNGICASVSPDGLKAWPQAELMYRPDVTAEPEVHAQVLTDADTAEFVAQDSRKAIDVLKGALHSGERGMRAAVLARIARNLRKLGRDADALLKYRDLIELGEVQVGGMPAALAGRVGMMSVDRVYAEALRDELLSGRWAISYGTFAALRQDVENRLGPVPFRTALADAGRSKKDPRSPDRQPLCRRYFGSGCWACARRLPRAKEKAGAAVAAKTLRRVMRFTDVISAPPGRYRAPTFRPRRSIRREPSVIR